MTSVALSANMPSGAGFPSGSVPVAVNRTSPVGIEVPTAGVSTALAVNEAPAAGPLGVMETATAGAGALPSVVRPQPSPL